MISLTTAISAKTKRETEEMNNLNVYTNKVIAHLESLVDYELERKLFAVIDSDIVSSELRTILGESKYRDIAQNREVVSNYKLLILNILAKEYNDHGWHTNVKGIKGSDYKLTILSEAPKS